jgi:hypothetical protein
LKPRHVARLANYAADFIVAHPEAATFFARKLSEFLHMEAEEQEERDREQDARARKQGFGT